MLLLADEAASLAEARERIADACTSGTALEKFRQMVIAQGGSREQLDHPLRLPTASVIDDLVAPGEGTISAMDAGALGWAAVHLGAGRQKKGQPVDPAVGFVMPVKVGDKLQRGDLLATIHANSEEALERARTEILNALHWSEEAVSPLPHFYGAIEGA
jgi:pyrimidine-nucleoside phosphorylase